MKFTKEKKELIQKTLKEKIGVLHCVECGSEGFTIDELEYHLLSLNRNLEEQKLENLLKHRIIANVICVNCGSVKLFDLVNLIGKEEALKF